MRLNDKQYKIIVRAGIALVVLAVFAYDKAPSQYHVEIAAIAALGALLGFFPLATSEPFRSNEDCQMLGSIEEDRRSQAIAKADIGERSETSLEVEPTGSISRNDWSDILGKTWVLDSYVAAYSERLAQAYHIVPASGVYSAFVEKHLSRDLSERAERVNEVHQLVNRLRGVPENFSVELTSTNSIIVRCEGVSRSALILAEYEKDLLSSEVSGEDLLDQIIQ